MKQNDHGLNSGTWDFWMYHTLTLQYSGERYGYLSLLLDVVGNGYGLPKRRPNCGLGRSSG